MAALYTETVSRFLATPNERALGVLAQQSPGATPEQHTSWKKEIVVLQQCLSTLASDLGETDDWGILLEYQMFRLHRRIDAVILAGNVVFVIEFKVGSERYDASAIRQTEDYALDLRDFHAGSFDRLIVPVLCATQAPETETGHLEIRDGVSGVLCANAVSLTTVLKRAYQQLYSAAGPAIVRDEWDTSSYSPVPSIIEAAELLYGAHNVDEIHAALADQKNLTATTDRLIEIISDAQQHKKRAICFVTGVPGSGKTLTGLNAVHDPRFRGDDRPSGAFLSGNSPLVSVLREALAKDEWRRTGCKIEDARRHTKTEIQLLMRYLEEYLTHDVENPPHEKVIVFDEAQRAWDADYGKKKFDRAASEPTLFLEIMGRHPDWCVIVALVGGGQEIYKGEGGLAEWGAAIEAFDPADYEGKGWEIHASPHVLTGDAITAGDQLFPGATPADIKVVTDDRLHLPVSIRSHRCEIAAEWTSAVLNGESGKARALADSITDFPVYLTRSLDQARAWLKGTTRGNRRSGLVASSGARRLRAYGLGVTLTANDLPAVNHWYLAGRDDVRSSYSLEVTANEFTCQGLELDRVGLCWGGDMTWRAAEEAWDYRAFKGTKWQNTAKSEAKINIKNSYRVLLTRAREAMVIWVPSGDPEDPTRPEGLMDQTAVYLRACGVKDLRTH